MELEEKHRIALGKLRKILETEGITYAPAGINRLDGSLALLCKYIVHVVENVKNSKTCLAEIKSIINDYNDLAEELYISNEEFEEPTKS
jgi:hypothetical protein